MKENQMKNIKSRYDWLCYAILLIGILLKVIYAMRVNYDISNHDLGTISDWNEVTKGHIGYIQYLYQYKKLPDTFYGGQFYHPPLFHLLGAMILYLFYGICGCSIETALEILQLVNTLFASGITILAYRICKRMHMKERTLVLITAYFSFSPVFYIIGNELNNDCLMTLFCYAAVYYTIVWMEKPQIFSIIKLALCIGFGMFSKTSAVFIAPATACVFLYVFIKKKISRDKLLIQFFLFGCISIPIGMFWVIRNKILFDLPFQYVQRLSNASPQFIKDVSLMERVGMPDLTQLARYRIDFSLPKEHANIWSQTFTTMFFDENILNISSQLEIWIAKTIWWCGVVIYGVCLYHLLKMMINRAAALPYRMLFAVGYFVLMGSYVTFCFEYPFVCTMNFRYVVITLLYLMASYGVVQMESKREDWLMTGLIGMYSFLSSVLFFFCA